MNFGVQGGSQAVRYLQNRIVELESALVRGGSEFQMGEKSKIDRSTRLLYERMKKLENELELKDLEITSMKEQFYDDDSLADETLNLRMALERSEREKAELRG